MTDNQKSILVVVHDQHLQMLDAMDSGRQRSALVRKAIEHLHADWLAELEAERREMTEQEEMLNVLDRGVQ